MQILEVILWILTALAVVAAVAIGFTRLKDTISERRREREEINLIAFKNNYIEMVTERNKELIILIGELLDESRELIAKSDVTPEQVDELEKGSIQIKSYMSEAMAVLGDDSEDLDETISSMTIFNSQLSRMVGTIDENINKLRDSLGIERIVN